jgi:hypothetical protein
MDEAQDEFQLETIADLHAIDAKLFLPFVVYRLRGESAAGEVEWAVTLREIGQPGDRKHRLRLQWSAETASLRPPGVAEHVITEWAALGVACAVILVYARLRIQAVSRQGDTFDYWVMLGEREMGLEVSGTSSTDVESRHRAKIRQWAANPYGVDGFVVTVGFSTREIIFSHHRFEETAS